MSTQNNTNTMKKIGILTQYYKNYNIGGLLQAYALVTVLNKHGYTAQQIAFDFQQLTAEEKRLRRELFTGNLFRRFTLPKVIKKIKLLLVRLRILQVKKLESSIQKQQDYLFAQFEQFIAHSEKVYTDQSLIETNSMYDIFVVGSDQVWSRGCLPFKAYFCSFASPVKKRLSYAASSNVKEFPPKAQKLFIQNLDNLTSISVREKTLKDYIERISDKKVTVVLDPTFLLSMQEWLKIANPAPVPQKPYIFCYFLGDKSAWQRQKAQEYADQYGYEMVHLPYIMRTIRSADRFLKGQGRYDVGPREFIALINGAQCVFTDSFHGLAFSINFSRNFYVFNRDDQSGPQSMNARITDTLATFGLTARYITDQTTVLNNKPLDFTKAHQILIREKEKSINWLLEAL